jgi:alpha-beta hydrolase superfamily lysophospholipase
VISWRNDGTAPDSNDHRYHLGDTECRGLDIAAEWALRHGARGLVPYGYSMGGSIVDAFLRRSRRASAVRAVVLDAPVLDWAAVLDHEFHDFRLPLPITPLKLTVWLTELLLAVRLGAVNLREHPEALDVHPTLLFQGSSDPVCSADITRHLTRRLGEQVTFIEVAGADHETAWNVDRQRYEKHLRSFLADVPSSAHS